MKYLNLKNTLLLITFLISASAPIHAQNPNILLVIADDLGVDFSNGYHNSNQMPTTPNIDNLRANGITFENVFSSSKCTPSRANIMSGKYGVKTNVLGTPGHLDVVHSSIFKEIENQTSGEYADAVIGKWHISSPSDPNHPSEHGVDYYTGLLSAMVDDYYAWQRTENGQTSIDSTYVTTALTDASIDWINMQNQPWFLWLAHPAPHSPFHTPPESLYTIGNTNTTKRKYIAAIEAVDHELGRLLDNIPNDVLQNTIILFLGDNGTPNGVLQDYPSGQGKGTMHQGGIRVPLIISGAGVSRQGERESALIHIADIYATLLEVVGAELPGGVHNSLSFKHLLSNDSGSTRDYNYSEQTDSGVNEFAIRESRYKLIEITNDGTQQFFDLMEDSLETNDLMIVGLDAIQQAIKSDLEQEATQIRTAWSCRDYIQNGDEEDIDCGGTYCSPCTTSNNETLSENDIKIYPNPIENELFLDLPTGDFSVKIMDVNGVLHQQINMPGGNQRIDLNSLPLGIYFLELVNTANNGVSIKKLIKR